MDEEKSPWTTMWFDPRGTIRNIIATNPNRNLFLLAVLGGIGQTFANAVALNLGDRMSTASVVLACIAIGPLNGLLTVYIGSIVIHWTSTKLGGFSLISHIRAAIAWSWVPFVSTLPLWIVKYILFRDELFKSEKIFIQSHSVLSTLYSLIGFIDIVLAIWSILLLYQAIGEVNGFSAWRGFAAVVLASIIIAVPFLLLFSVCAGPIKI